MKEVILTGLRANGELHLGSYLGAMLPMAKLQQEHTADRQVNIFVPDLHSLTTPIDHGTLQSNINTNLRMFVAAGIDLNNENTYLYRQSHIPAHSELAWLLDCFTYYGEANRMVEFKEKADRIGSETVTIGLFNYPVLMAADILLYGAQWIPVGEDQRQHLELTRTIARRINNKFGEIFVVPHETKKQLEFAGSQKPIRIRSLANPSAKMSKSISDPRGTILLSDDPKDAAKKVMGATTDSLGVIAFNHDTQPGISNLLEILALLRSEPIETVVKEWEGKTAYGELKKAVADVVEQFLISFQTKLAAVDQTLLQQKLESSESAMNITANDTLLRMQKAVGLRT